jgi:hypothetical protein
MQVLSPIISRPHPIGHVCWIQALSIDRKFSSEVAQRKTNRIHKAKDSQQQNSEISETDFSGGVLNKKEKSFSSSFFQPL